MRHAAGEAGLRIDEICALRWRVDVDMIARTIIVNQGDAARDRRHAEGTHAALFGVNPWRLMTWLGPKRIDETMRYVHVADSHRRELPREILAAAEGELDPDRRISRLMGGRAEYRQPDGNTKEGHANRVAFQVLTGGVDGT